MQRISIYWYGEPQGTSLQAIKCRWEHSQSQGETGWGHIIFLCFPIFFLSTPPITTMMQEQWARVTPKLSYIYLDSTSLFHQMFRANYMTNVRQVDVALRGNCNAGESHSNEKGCVIDMFCMWLVSSGITNLLYLPMLEWDGYVCQYHTNST